MPSVLSVLLILTVCLAVVAKLHNFDKQALLRNDVTNTGTLAEGEASLQYFTVSLLSFIRVSVFSEAVPNNDPLLQLQLQSAGSLRAAFRNLTESRQSSRRTSKGKPEDILSVKNALISLKLLFRAVLVLL